MAFQDEHSPSIPAKVLLSASVLAGTLAATLLTSGQAPPWLVDLLGYEPTDGNPSRQLLLLVCCLIYFVRFTIAMFVFVQRKISWFEGGLVSFLFFMLFYLFGVSAGRHPEAMGLIELVGVVLFLSGSYLNTGAEYQRYRWKRRAENEGRLYTSGLFRYAMHINYFGDSLTYLGLTLITLELVPLLASLGIIVNFLVLQIPKQDQHLAQKYGSEFSAYAEQTKKFIPFIY